MECWPRRPPFLPTVLVCFLTCLSAVGGAVAQVGFPEQLTAAIEADQYDSALRLVRSNRLQVKPFVDENIGLALTSERAGDVDLSLELLDHASRAAAAFQEAFGETSLTRAVSSVQGWSIQDRALKIAADSLEALATSLRAVAATREESLAHFQAALSLYQNIGDARGVAQALGGIGYLHWSLDRSQYLRLNLLALDARVAADDHQLTGNTLYDVGLAYQFVDRDYEQALRYYRRSDSVRVAIGDSLALNRMLPAVASLYRTTGDLPRSRRYYERSIRAHERAGDDRLLAISERNLGVLLSYMGFHSDALPHLQRAQAIHKARGETDDVAPVVNWIGVVYRRLGDYDGAVAAYQQAIKIAEEAENTELLGWAYNNLGVVLAYAGRYPRATTFYNRALEAFQGIGLHAGILDATLNIADGYYELGDYALAEEYGARAGVLADSLGDPTRQGRALGTLASVYAQTGRVPESEAAFDELAELARFTNMSELEWGALLQRAHLEGERGAIADALTHYEKAFEALERTRMAQLTDEDKSGYLAQQRYAFEDYTHFLGDLHADDPGQDYLSRAFEFTERGKARSFLDLLAEALANVSEGVEPGLLARQNDIWEALAGARATLAEATSNSEAGPEDARNARALLDSLETGYDLLQREIRSSNPRYADLQYPQTATIQDVQRGLLDSETALLEYAVGDSSSTLWVITSEGSSMHRLPARAEIQEQVELFRFALSDPARTDAETYAATAARLYQMLLQTAETELADIERLIIVPDDVLHYIPFEALVTDTTGNPSFATMPYLIARHAVSYAPSASVLLQVRSGASSREQGDRKDLLAFGDPTFSESDNLAQLPFAGLEVDAISKLFDSGRSDVYQGDDASERRAKTAVDLSGYRYVHFATHGLINEDRPDFSGIALATDALSDDDGFLQAAEVFNLKIDADLVVLSACETGLGRLVRGEGLVGLTRAFMYAGAPSVVVSLWAVADQSTATLMEGLYTRLAPGTESRDESLRGAKRQMIASGENAHPFFWAPFVLVGDGL
ncbi:MAG: CHAT domain-containing protein/tetratricopeptide (TPR) repeat protein [Rhodothermales bacterium]|jgi:CHAT domain-containing protein/tetratricopeptide (TPR) repeat protein